MAKKVKSKKVVKKPRLVVLGVGHPFFGKVDGPSVIGYQKILLLEGNCVGDAITLNIGKLGCCNKIRLIAEVIS